MTKKDVKKSVEDMKEFTKKVASSKKKAREFLVKAGISTCTGKLTKPYK